MTIHAKTASLLLTLTVLVPSTASAGPNFPNIPSIPLSWFDGEIVTSEYVAGLVESEGHTYLDHDMCRDELDEKIDGCLDIDIMKANGAKWSYRLEEDACDPDAGGARAFDKPCYAGFEHVAKVRHTSAFYLSEDGYDLIDSQVHFIASLAGWTKVMQLDATTHVQGWSISSGVSTDISVVVSDGQGTIIDSEIISSYLIADSDGSTPSVVDKCASARDRMVNTGYDLSDAIEAILDWLLPDSVSVPFISQAPIWVNEARKYNQKKQDEAASVFYDECLSHASNFFPELFDPGDIGDDPMFDPLDPVYIDEEATYECAESSFNTNYTAYIEIGGVTYTCGGVAAATCGTLSTGACGCVYEFVGEPTCGYVEIE